MPFDTDHEEGNGGGDSGHEGLEEFAATLHALIKKTAAAAGKCEECVEGALVQLIVGRRLVSFGIVRDPERDDEKEVASKVKEFAPKGAKAGCIVVDTGRMGNIFDNLREKAVMIALTEVANQQLDSEENDRPTH